MRLSGVLLAFLTAVAPASAQDSLRIVIATGAETDAGQILQRALSRPHIVMDGGERPMDLPRSSVFDRTVIVVAPSVTVSGRVEGDVIVVGGDLFLHPGARIAGDVVALGGGAYPSTLATVSGERRSFRDETFDAARESNVITLTHRTTRVEYAAGWIEWPFRVGVRIPTYNRIDGLALPWGPILSFADGGITIDPTVTYRSDLGNFEPALRATFTRGDFDLELDARRSTFSDDKWIRNELLNSATTFFFGRDTRNYYRGDRIELTARARFSGGDISFEPFIGGLDEFGWSSGAELSSDTHPFALFGKDSTDGIYRPNPQVERGRIRSALGGVEVRWEPEDVTTRLNLRYEHAWRSPTVDFDQLTSDLRVTFPTFADQSLRIRMHAVRSWGDSTPPLQRWAYVGGSGTIPTMDLLEEGGSQLFFAAGDYEIPLPAIQLPFLGSPTLTLRYITGGADTRWLPDLTQNIGARLGLGFIGVQYLIDPESKEKKLGIGFTLDF